MGTDGHAGDPELDAQGKSDAEESQDRSALEVRGDLFIDVTAPDPRIVIFGAVEYASAPFGVPRTCGWRPHPFDLCARFATPERFPDALRASWRLGGGGASELGAPDKATYIVDPHPRSKARRTRRC